MASLVGSMGPSFEMLLVSAKIILFLRLLFKSSG